MKEILDAFAEHGLDPGPLTLDGKIHKFKIDGRDSKSSGWYIGHQNHCVKSAEVYYVVIFDNYREGNEEPYKFVSGGVQLSSVDKKNIQAQIAKANKESHKDREVSWLKISQEAQDKWDSLSKTGESEYLIKKQIEACPDMDIRFDEKGHFHVPIRDTEGKLWSLQEIYWDSFLNRSQKYYFKGGRTKNCCYVFGDLATENSVVYIVEGFATGASVRLASGHTVVCALSANGLSSIARSIRIKYAECRIIICAERDPNNIGFKKSTEAANESLASVIIPKFKEGDAGSDFNDVHCLYGLEQVKIQLEINLPEIAKEDLVSFNIMDVPYPDQDERTFKKKGTMVNVAELMRRLKIHCRYNVISKEEEILLPGYGFTSDNKANATLAYVIDWCERVGIPHGNLDVYLTGIAENNLYNPVATWIESKPWDGVSRLSDLYGTITAKGESDPDNAPTVNGIKETVMKRWLVSAVAALYEPNGVSAHGVLVFQGDQNVGKTYWLKRLAPPTLNVISDGMFLRPDDKDSVYQAVSHWIVELGELDATFKKSEISMIKAFVTKNKDILRRPYAKKESVYARRTVFAGSVNDLEFLRDPTGNRRFWTIEVESIDYEHEIDMQQLWAEVRLLYRGGEPWILSRLELEVLNKHNEKFQEKTPVEERLINFYAWNQDGSGTFKTSTEICLEIGLLNPTQRDKNAATGALKKLAIQERMIDGYRQFRVPLRKSTI